ncbi:MAG TPA: BON domain-containing protein [Rudaea sp.]|nr:BON domain-containing protein [Rudaea sp.]
MKTDGQLQQDVMEELKWEPAVEASTIGVEAKDGVVTLAGHVETYAQKWAAERAAQRVSGVKGVVVEIDVSLPGSSRRKDADLVQAACSALDWNSSVPPGRIRILVSDGVVTLSGEVDWAFQRSAAIAAVRNLIGVRGLDNQITLKPHPVRIGDVKKKIHSALQRQAQLDAKAISIDVDGTSVTLGGVVDSWSERAAARNAAWSVPGVQYVIDNLSVAD